MANQMAYLKINVIHGNSSSYDGILSLPKEARHQHMSWTLWRNSIDSSFNNFYTKNPMSGNINMTAAVAPFWPWADLDSDLISIIAPCCMLRALRSRRDLYQ